MPGRLYIRPAHARAYAAVGRRSPAEEPAAGATHLAWGARATLAVPLPSSLGPRPDCRPWSAWSLPDASTMMTRGPGPVSATRRTGRISASRGPGRISASRGPGQISATRRLGQSRRVGDQDRSRRSARVFSPLRTPSSPASSRRCGRRLLLRPLRRRRRERRALARRLRRQIHRHRRGRLCAGRETTRLIIV